MCGISGVELLVIIVASIVILGPEKLPELMGHAGKLARDLRKMRGQLGDVTRELRSQVKVDELGKELGVDRVRERMREAESEIDAIRARLNRTAELPGHGEPAAGAGGTTGAAAPEPDAGDSGGEPDTPRIRTSQGSVARGHAAEPSIEPGPSSEPAPLAPPPSRVVIRPNAFGAPEAVELPEEPGDGGGGA